jgi:hypothetical protein
MSNQLGENYKSKDVRDIQSLQDNITGDIVTIMMGLLAKHHIRSF